MDRGVQGVILEASFLFSNADNFNQVQAQVNPHAEKLLHRLLYSHLRVGILFRDSNGVGHPCTPQNNALLNSIPSGCSVESKVTDEGSLLKVLKEFIVEWDIVSNGCVFFTMSLDDRTKTELMQQGWHICAPQIVERNDTSLVRISQCIQDLFDEITHVNKETCSEINVVGYTMKWSRETDFLKRGAFPLTVINKSLTFYPLNLELPLPQQMEIVDIVLHKPTDEITGLKLMNSSNIEDQVKFTDAMQQLLRYLKNHPEICVIDPIEKIFPLLDRALTQEILGGLSHIERPDRRIRAPKYLKADCMDIPQLSKRLEDHQLYLPVIIKPQMACGVHDAHRMAVVFKAEGFHSLSVPSPWTIQEYIDHGARLYKFYMIGNAIFHSIRKSTPDAGTLTGNNSTLPALMAFDSLRSLPMSFIDDGKENVFDTTLASSTSDLDLQLVHEAASWLKEKLNLTIFGFDVVVQVNTHDHIIIDVNFFPSFKDVDENRALSAFWDALSKAYSHHRERKI